MQKATPSGLGVPQTRQFIEAGADLVTIHAENGEAGLRAVKLAHELGAEAGVVLRLETPVAAIVPFLPEVAFVTLLGTSIGVKGQSLSEQAGKSQLYAGLQFPTDYYAGLDLGRKVAARAIEVAKLDGSDAVWTGAVPAGKCMWVGANPGNVTAATWKPFLLSSPSEFRPSMPPACDSAQMVAEVADVKNFPRSPAAFATNQRAMYWQSPEGLSTWPYAFANKWMFEDKLEPNAPRWARVYALIAASLFDAFIASQDGKFAYWYIRPPQLEPAIVPLFPVPNFPSYPSNHSTFSATRSEMLAYLFPQRAELVRGVGKEAGDSRIWAGIHYPIDNVSGVALGKAVVQKFIAWAGSDGSQ